jgi:hypothetical protein
VKGHDNTTHLPVWREFVVVPANVYDSIVGGSDLLDVSMTQILGTAVATPATAGILDVNVKNIDNDAASASGTVTFPNATLASTTNITAAAGCAVSSIGANVITATSIAGDAITAAKIADGAIDAATFAAGAINAAAIAANALGASQLAADGVTEIRSLASGTSDSGSTTTMVDAARTEADTDYWVGSLIVFTSGTIAGQARQITGFNAGSDTITFAPATTQAVSTQTYEIWPSGDYLRSTVAGRTLDVSSGGEAGLDWANIGSPTTAQNLSSTNIDVDQVVASVSGAVGSVTGAVGSVTGNVGGNVTGTIGGLTAAALADFFDTNSGTTYAGAVAGSVVKEIADNAGGGTPPTAAEIADAVWDEDATAHQTTGTFGQAIGDPVADTNTIYGAVVTGAAGATIAADVIAVKAETASIQSDTDNIQTRLPAALVSGRMDSSVGAMAADTITASALATGAVDELVDAVWDEDVDASHQTAGSAGKKLDDAGGAADPWATALPGAYGSGTAGKIVGDNLNATVSSRATQTSVDTIDDFLDTEVAAIQAKTNNLPASPAATSDIPSAATIADAVWDEAQAGHVAGGSFGEIATEIADILVDTGTTLQGEVDGIQADTEDIQSRLPAALVSGRIDASVGAMASGVVTAAAIGTDAIDGDAIAASAVTEIQSGLATAAALDTVDNFLDTEIADIQARLPAALTAGGNMKSDALAIDGSTTAADRIQRSAETIVLCTVGSGSTTTSIVTSAMDPAAVVTDGFKGRIAIFDKATTTANLRGQATDITASTSGGVLTVTALTTAPVSGDSFTIT